MAHPSYPPLSPHAHLHRPQASPPLPIPLSDSLESRQDILTGLRSSPAHYNLLLDWRAEDYRLLLRAHRKKQNLSAAEAEIYQLLGMFSLLQGVFFTALTQTNVFRCEDWYLPFVMSCIVCVATALAVEVKIWTWAEINSDLIHIRQEALALYECMEILMYEGCHFDLNRLNYLPRVLPSEYDDSNCAEQLFFDYIRTHSFAMRATVIVLSTIVMISCPKILCRGCKCQH